MTAYVAHRVKKLITPKKLIEEIDSVPEPPPQCPSGKLKLHVRVRDTRVQENLLSHSGGSSGVRVGTSPAMKTDGTKFVPISNSLHRETILGSINKPQLLVPIKEETMAVQIISSTQPPPLTATQQHINLRKRNDVGGTRMGVSASGHLAQIVQTTSGRHILLTPTTSGTSGK